MKIVKRFFVILLAAGILISSFTIFASADNKELPEPDITGFYDVGNCKLEYCVYGADIEQSLLILTGNGGDMHGHDGNILPGLIGKYKIICVSVRGTGNSDLGDEHVTFELEASDLNKLLDYLKVRTTYVYGFSDGGNLGLVFTLNYPEKVTKLCVQSPNINILGTNAYTQLQVMWQYFVLCVECKFIYKDDPSYIRRREIKGMMANQPNLKFSDLENISIPVLHIHAQHDMMYPLHSKLITKSIPDCEEIIIKDADHTSAFESSDTIIVPALLDFFG